MIETRYRKMWEFYTKSLTTLDSIQPITKWRN
jgi:hypothetical protein